jgi:hypothetical protein
MRYDASFTLFAAPAENPVLKVWGESLENPLGKSAVKIRWKTVRLYQPEEVV